MTILYDVASIQVGVGRRYHGTIDAKPAGPEFNGHFDKDGGRWVPDYKTIADCLPYHWRKAWARRSSIWFTATAGAEQLAVCDLLDVRGRLIARLVFTPYSFTAGEPSKREALPRLHTL